MRDDGANPVISCRDVWKLFGFQGRLGPEIDPASLCDGRNGVVPAVRDVTLDIVEGEIFVIMGLSGSGKSTLVRCLSGLVDLTQGSILVDGQDLSALPARDLVALRRHKMGMVFQDFALLPHLSVLENVAFPLRIQGMRRDEREQTAREMIEVVGLKGRESHFPNELSGGQQQRVGIARSLTTKPAIWFLDEPFSALDPLIRYGMQDELLRLQKMLNKTIVFITHDFSEGVRIADRIAIMEAGRLVQVGTPQELVTAPADDYVAEFTVRIPKAKVLTAGTIMNPAGAVGERRNADRLGAGAPVAAEMTLEAIAPRVLASDAAVPVVGLDGAIVGSVTRQMVIDALFAEQAPQ